MDESLIRKVVEGSEDRMVPVAEALITLMESSWADAVGLATLREVAAGGMAPADAARALLDALAQTADQFDGAVFWWKDHESHFLGGSPSLPTVASIASLEAMLGLNDASPEVPWNRQAAHYMRDDREVMESGAPKVNILERQDRDDGSTVWLRTSKVPYALGGKGAGTVGGFDTIDDAAAKKLAKG